MTSQISMMPSPTTPSPPPPLPTPSCIPQCAPSCEPLCISHFTQAPIQVPVQMPTQQPSCVQVRSKIIFIFWMMSWQVMEVHFRRFLSWIVTATFGKPKVVSYWPMKMFYNHFIMLLNYYNRTMPGRKHCVPWESSSLSICRPANPPVIPPVQQCTRPSPLLPSPPPLPLPRVYRSANLRVTLSAYRFNYRSGVPEGAVKRKKSPLDRAQV